MRCSPPRSCRAASRSPASGSITPRTPLCWRSAFSRPDMRVGIGYDSHRFAEGEGRKLILGAAGLGDIGQMFPPTDPRWRDADSIDLLKKAYLRVVEAGFSFVSADITVLIEQPRLARYLDDMRENLAGALVSGYSMVSVKAKTNEGMGWIGKGEGVAALAVALLEQAS